MELKVPYGKSFLSCKLSFDLNIMTIKPLDIKPREQPISIIKNAITNPINSSLLNDILKKDSKICIVINDKTRKTPSNIILKGILDSFQNQEIPDDNITLLIANGNHRANIEEEIIEMIGSEYYSRFKIVNHRAKVDSDLVDLGSTDLGIPISVNRHIVEADVKILTGTIRPHQSGGFSGGRKSILPGVAGLKSIKKHHSLIGGKIAEPQLGKIEDNIFHTESLVGAKRVGIDFIVNVIENSKGEIIDAVAGELNTAHMEGVKRARYLWEIPIDSKVDIIIASAGGYPKDINLHQTQKALASCEYIVKPGGTVILVAECFEGAGKIPEWFEDTANPKEAIEKFKRVGWSPDVHAKPFLIARALTKFNLIMVKPNICIEDLKKIFIDSADSLQEAVDRTLNMVKQRTPNPEIIYLPYAGDVIPVLNSTIY